MSKRIAKRVVGAIFVLHLVHVAMWILAPYHMGLLMAPHPRTCALALAVVALSVGVLAIRAQRQIEAEWEELQHSQREAMPLAAECDRMFRVYDCACVHFTAYQGVGRIAWVTGAIGGAFLVAIALAGAWARRHPRLSAALSGWLLEWRGLVGHYLPLS
jgi:hypothetical protein